MCQRWFHALTRWILRKIISTSHSVSLRAASAMHVALNFVIRILATFHICISFHLTRRLLCHHHKLVRILTAVKFFIGYLCWNRRWIKDVEVCSTIRCSTTKTTSWKLEKVRIFLCSLKFQSTYLHPLPLVVLTDADLSQ